jgi:xylulokinase
MKQQKNGNFFLGLDASTQSLKATFVDERLDIVFEESVVFDSDLPQYQTRGGVQRAKDALSVTSPVLMWVEALDLLFARLKEKKTPLNYVAAISGSGQQHGSVYLRSAVENVLKKLNKKISLREQLKDCFSLQNSPVWMDSSTTLQCRQRDAALGGKEKVAELTGSRSYERFTGNQIAKIFQHQPEVYAETAFICLVSSFFASILIGRIAPFEPGDASGMNLMDIRSKRWLKAALECTAPELEKRLANIVPSHNVIGKVAPYFIEKYGVSKNALVIAFSGDNPCSLASFGLAEAGDIAVSLGTSDTMFGAMKKPHPSAYEGHIFGNPIDPKGYMALICYKNGSLTREMIRDACAEGSWRTFEELLSKTAVGNNGKIGFYFKEPEITPTILNPGIYRFDRKNNKQKEFLPEEDVRAIIEGQFLSMRLHSSNIGLVPKKILATGGASVNKGIMQVLADVFGVEVMISVRPNSASLGAALRALHGWQCFRRHNFIPFNKVIDISRYQKLSATPIKQNVAVYNPMIKRYAGLEAKIVKNKIRA